MDIYKEESEFTAFATACRDEINDLTTQLRNVVRNCKEDPTPENLLEGAKVIAYCKGRLKFFEETNEEFAKKFLSALT